MNGASFCLVLAVAAQLSTGRPSKPCEDLQACLCSSSKLMTMTCEGVDLTEVPRTRYSQQVTYLALPDNRIDFIPGEAFSNYSRVMAIYLSNAGIRAIHKDAFKALAALKELDLSFNPLGHLDPDTFAQNRALQSLVLMGNEFLRLPDGPVLASGSLRKLDLSYCGIGELSADAFARLPNLRQLDLGSNKLAALPAATLLPVKLLEDVKLDGNEWRCDCRLHELLGWTDRLHGRPVQYRAAMCVAENGKDMMLWSLEEQGQQCPSEAQEDLTRGSTGAPRSRSGRERQGASKGAIESSKPDVISVGDEETSLENRLERSQASGIKIFNGLRPEILSQNDRDVEEQEEVVEIDVEERLTMGSLKPEKISLIQGEVLQRRSETREADNPASDSGKHEDEDGHYRITFISPTTLRIINLVALACVGVAVVALACVLAVYACSAGRNVYTRLRRQDSLDSHHYESPSDANSRHPSQLRP